MERLADVVLFHHVQGLTPGIVAFADELRAAGHTVHTPDLFDGRTFPTLEEGMAHAKTVGFDAILDRGVSEAEAFGPTWSMPASRWASCPPRSSRRPGRGLAGRC